MDVPRQVIYEFLDSPAGYTIVGCTLGNFCEENGSCIEILLDMQRKMLREGLNGTTANNVINKNAKMFKGRNINILNIIVNLNNNKCNTKMFMTHYGPDPLNKQQFDRLKIYMKEKLHIRICPKSEIHYIKVFPNGHSQKRTKSKFSTKDDPQFSDVEIFSQIGTI